MLVGEDQMEGAQAGIDVPVEGTVGVPVLSSQSRRVPFNLKHFPLCQNLPTLLIFILYFACPLFYCLPIPVHANLLQTTQEETGT
jgi:hypothetical protein